MIYDMTDKKGMILIRFPKEQAELLRRVSFELDIPIKDIVSDIVSEHLDAWFAEVALRKFGETHATLGKIKSVLEQVPVATFTNNLEKRVGEIEETREYLQNAIDMIKHGVVPLDLLVSAPSPEGSSQEAPQLQYPASTSRQKKKSP
jgi:hypothetical protein